MGGTHKVSLDDTKEEKVEDNGEGDGEGNDVDVQRLKKAKVSQSAVSIGYDPGPS